jgi:hypothetical protein
MNTTEFFQNLALYSEVEINALNKSACEELWAPYKPVDLNCTRCAKDTAFNSNMNYNDVQKLRSGFPHVGFNGEVFKQVILFCSRCGRVATFFLRLTKDSITKVGQYPTVADMVSIELKRFKNLLGEDYAELTKAVGLASHGIGIGAYVYLRRIFERLIIDAHEAHSAIHGPLPNFQTLRMEERIFALQEWLPEALVSNRGLYGILSKGIHELTESECKAYFDPVAKGIEMILDEKLDQTRKKARDKEIRESLAKITSNLKTTPR